MFLASECQSAFIPFQSKTTLIRGPDHQRLHMSRPRHVIQQLSSIIYVDFKSHEQDQKLQTRDEKFFIVAIWALIVVFVQNVTNATLDHLVNMLHEVLDIRGIECV